MAITRIWHGTTPRSKALAYREFLLTEGTKEYIETEGNLSVKVWEQEEGDITHFWTVTEWVSLEAIQQFAGSEYTQAVYYDFDDDYLLEFEPTVNHHLSFNVGQVKIKSYIQQLSEILDPYNPKIRGINYFLGKITAATFSLPSAKDTLIPLLFACNLLQSKVIRFVNMLQEKDILAMAKKDSELSMINLLPKIQEKHMHIIRSIGVQRDYFLDRNVNGLILEQVIGGYITEMTFILGQLYAFEKMVTPHEASRVL